MWTLIEKDGISKALLPHSVVRTALEKFLTARADARNADCAQAMRTDPPQYHRATQYAAQAQLYEELLADLERQCEKDGA